MRIATVSAALAVAAALSLTGCAGQQVIATNPDGSQVVKTTSRDITLQSTPDVSAPPTWADAGQVAGWSTDPEGGDGQAVVPAGQDSSNVLYQQGGSCVAMTGTGFALSFDAGQGDQSLTRDAFAAQVTNPTNEGRFDIPTNAGGTIEFYGGQTSTVGGVGFTAVRVIDKLFPNGKTAADFPALTEQQVAQGMTRPSDEALTHGLPSLALTVTCGTAADLAKVNMPDLMSALTVNLPSN